MVDAALEVFNQSSGLLNVDHLYANISLRSKGTASTDTFTATYSTKEITVTGATAPVFAWSCSTAAVLEKTQNPSAGTWVFRLRVASTSATSFDYYIFDTPDPGVAAQFIEICDGSGTPTFKGNLKYLNIVDFNGPIRGGNTTTGGVPDNGGAVIDTTYASGRTYAVIMAVAAFYLASTVSGSPPNQTVTYAYKSNFALLSSNVLRTQGLAVDTASGPIGAFPPVNYTITGYWIVVDVTGF